MSDYILVGFGLAGASLAHHLENRKLAFTVFEDQSQHSSKVAGGLYNPVVLKRYTLAWDAEQQLETVVPFYKSVAKKIGVPIQKDLPVHRKFHSAEEQNNWFRASGKPGLEKFLNPKLVKKHDYILSEYQFGVVNETGAIDLPTMLDYYSGYLKRKKQFIGESFDYNSLEIKTGFVRYKDLEAKKIIFCEGFGLKRNPFFNALPLNGTKGEFILVKAPELKLKEAVKSSIFIIPQGNNTYKVGATYDWGDKTPEPTKLAREELTAKLKKLISCDFEIIGQTAGIRPTVIDRRPLVGRHPKYHNLYVCNGFGTRGVMLAPTVSRQLIEFIEEGKSLPKEIDIRRFEKEFP